MAKKPKAKNNPLKGHSLFPKASTQTNYLLEDSDYKLNNPAERTVKNEEIKLENHLASPL